jgi:prevent-host-death family protein
MVHDMTAKREKSIGVTAFKARCLGLIDEVAAGRTKRVILTKRGRPIAEIVPRSQTAIRYKSGYGALKHLMKLDDAVDLTAPTGIEFDPERIVPADG